MKISGWAAQGYEGVRDAFADNIESGREVGASFSAYHRGEKIVDLWGGIADQETGRPWEEDTVALVFSTAKGMTAICANKLVQEGALDPDAPVVDHWPEFGKNGKHDMAVSHLLSHQAGLAWVDGDLTLEEALSWEPVIEALENQHPNWQPGSAHGYHATTFGWLVGEVVRRVAGRSVGTYLREEIADPLSLDLWIGLPEEHEPRVAPLVSMLPGGITVDMLADPGNDPILKMFSDFLGPQTPLGKALYAPCINEVDGIRLLTPDQLDRAITQQTEGPNTVLLGLDIQFGLGFMLRSPIIPLGGPRSFGHFGAGGSVGWADPDAELAFGYVMNKMDLGLTGDVRSSSLVNARYAAL